jgi:hypothetical protein
LKKLILKEQNKGVGVVGLGGDKPAEKGGVQRPSFEKS